MRTSGLLIGVSAVWIPLAFLFDGVTLLILPLRVGVDATTLGLISLAGLGIAAGLQPVAGWLSDRLRGPLDRRLFMAAAALPTLGGLWLLVGSSGVLAALAGYIAVQVGATAIQAAQQALIPEHVDRSSLGRASGLKAAFDIGGAFIAFVVLGALLVGGDLVPAALFISLVLGAALAVALLLVPRSTRSLGLPRVPTDLPRGFASLVASRFLFLFGTYAVGRFLLLLTGERLGLPPERVVDEAGWLLAILALATAAAAVPFGLLADRWSRRGLMVVGAIAGAAGIVLLAPAAGMAGLLVGGLTLAVGTAAFVTANWAATAAVVPAPDAGRLMAIANLGTGLAAAGAGLLGPVIDAAGFVPALLLAATATGLAIAPLAAGVPRPNPSEGHAT